VERKKALKEEAKLLEALNKAKLTKRDFLKASALIGVMALAGGGGLLRVNLMSSMKSESEESYSQSSEQVAPLSISLKGAREVSVANAGDAVIKLLKAYGVKHIFCSVDDEINTMLDSLTGDKDIKHILILHEYGAVAAADGYAAASNKVGVALIGGFVGANAHDAVINAYLDYRPVLIIGACLGPEYPIYGGGQIQTEPQAIFDPWTKWNWQVVDNDNLVKVLLNGLMICQTPPKGPVFINFYQNLTREKIGTIKIPSVDRMQPPSPPMPSSDVLKQVAKLLVDAESPLIVTTRLGRNKEAVPKLVELAETLAIPVIEGYTGFKNFPWHHPLHLGCDPAPYLKDTDVLFVIDSTVPAGVPETAKVIVLSEDPVRSFQWVASGIPGHMNREADIRMIADSNVAIPALLDVIKDMISYKWDKLMKYRDRYEEIKEEHDRQRKEWKDEAEKHLGEKPISAWQFYYELNKVIDKDTIISNAALMSFFKIGWKLLELDEPGSYICTLGGAGCLVPGPFAAIGIKEACPDKKVIQIVGDGGWQWGHGDKALWTASHHGIPVLYVIDNNHCLLTTKIGQMKLKGKGYETKNYWAHDLVKPMLDFTYMAKGADVWAKKVEDPDDLEPTLREALKVVTEEKRPALVDVWTKPIAGVESWELAIKEPKIQ